MQGNIADKKIKYESAIYEVFAEKTFIFKINQYLACLADEITKRKVKSAAFITAYNPFGLINDAKSNSERQLELIKALNSRNLNFLEGKGYDAKCSWEPEMSVLVFGIDFEAAKTLGTQLDQLAIVWIDETFIPKLVMLDDIVKLKVN